MNQTHRETDGIVLDSHDHGESDMIVTLYCRDSGRCAAIAKGARKSKRRFVNKLELFSFLHLSLRQRGDRSLAFLEEAELHSGFIQLRKDLPRYIAASVIREFTLYSTREGEEDERLFSLLLWAFHKLDQGLPHLQVVMLFLVRFYDYIGYRPEFHKCFHCGTRAEPHGVFGFNIAVGGLVCPACTGSNISRAMHLSPGTIMILQSCQDIPLDRLHRLRIGESNLYEALNILHRYGRHVLQRDIISWKMLRKTISPQQITWPAQR